MDCVQFYRHATRHSVTYKFQVYVFQTGKGIILLLHAMNVHTWNSSVPPSIPKLCVGWR